MPKNATVRTFAPEHWEPIDVFAKFYVGTYEFNPDVRKAVSGVTSHVRKAMLLRNVAVKIIPNLDVDERELEEHGATRAENSHEFSAVIEEVLTELYSSVESTRKIVTAIYKKVSGVPDSTRKMFNKIQDGGIGSGFPSELRSAFEGAVWFNSLRMVRDELTHSDVGRCWRDKDTGKIRYHHNGIFIDGERLDVADVIGWVDSFTASVVGFHQAVFAYLNTQLRPTEADILCGVFGGRAYMRKLSLETPIDFNSGVCQARKWFDSDPAHKCPFSETCGAYVRAGTAASKE